MNISTNRNSLVRCMTVNKPWTLGAFWRHMGRVQSRKVRINVFVYSKIFTQRLATKEVEKEDFAIYFIMFMKKSGGDKSIKATHT